MEDDQRDSSGLNRAPMSTRIIGERRAFESFMASIAMHPSDARLMLAFIENLEDSPTEEDMVRLITALLQQSTGLSKEQIKKNTVTFSYRPPTTRLVRRASGGYERPAAPTCSICMNGFGWGATVRRLACFDFFHARCIDRWLESNNECPNCRTLVMVDYHKVIPGCELDANFQLSSVAHRGYI